LRHRDLERGHLLGTRGPPGAPHLREVRCGSSVSLGSLIRAQRTADQQLLDACGKREPQVTSEWCGQAVRQAKELDTWVSRVRETREQAQRADARLGEALREARLLSEELRLGREDLAWLRSQAEFAKRERAQWEDQLEVSRSCIHKLECKLIALRRRAAELPLSPEAERAKRELQELQQQRDRLMREKSTLERLSAEHEREVRILTRALRASPSVPPVGSESIADILENDLCVARERAEVMCLEEAAADQEMEELQHCQRAGAAEIASVCSESAAMAARLSALEGEAEELRAVGGELSARAASASMEERAAREEEAALQHELEGSTDQLYEEEAERAKALQNVRGLEASLASARRRVASTEAENRARASELEACGEALCMELRDHATMHRREVACRAAREAENMELEAHIARLRSEVEMSEAAGTRLEAAFAAASRGVAERARQLRAEEDEGRALAVEVAGAERREETLRDELVDERRRAQDASRVAAALLEQRRRVADEADQALRLCDGALDESRASAAAAQARDDQLARSERSCELMRCTLSQRLAAVHEQVREAEGAHAAAALELREERVQQQRLRAQLQGENARRRARLSRGALPLRDGM